MSTPAKILLVEDNPDTVEFLGRRLADAGYDVRIARNGADALVVARQESPDALVLDINLPQLDGDAVARQLRTEPGTRHVPIVFMTAESADRVADLVAAGNVVCLEKAIKSKSLLEALQGLLPPPRLTPEGPAPRVGAGPSRARGRNICSMLR